MVFANHSLMVQEKKKYRERKENNKAKRRQNGNKE